MNLNKFIETSPSPAEIASVICAVANNNVLEIDETFVWSPLAELGGFTRADFVDDVQATFDAHGAEALDVYGMKNWKLNAPTAGEKCAAAPHQQSAQRTNNPIREKGNLS